jgi:glutaredoxin
MRVMPWNEWVRSWWKTAPRRLEQWRVILYTRQGCHLCDRAWDLLAEAQRRHGYSLEKVDIDTDPALVAEHGLHVPAVAVNGKVRFRGVVNAVLLQRLFDAEE